jgi:RHS repeat-associated protein
VAYDQDWKGALSSVSTTVSSTAYTHDGFGRIKTSTQTTGAAPGYTFVYTYNLTDQLTKMQYPSGRTVSYVPDSAGRISAVKNEATGLFYAQNIGYTPSGAMSTMTLGNGVVEQRTWNDRLQLTGLTATRSGTTLLGLGLYPCSGLATSCSSGNADNIQGQTIAFPGLSLTQNYTYDVLARIATVNEGSGSWKRGYGYDAAGNRYVDPDPAKTAGYNVSSFSPTGTSNFDANNRLGVNNSAYDPSGVGNQTAIGGYTYTFDAENRMISANLGGGGTEVSSAGYVYDGQGQRVQKITCPAGTYPCTAASTGATALTYVYDAFGDLAAEYGGSSGTQAGCGTPTCYLSVDQLGSTRVVTDANGNAVRRYDYTPFGEELWAGTGGRTTAMGYQSGPDGFNPKFTGQHRDTENFLDYFRARYYSPQQGRFVSVDPENAGAALANPQTWNGYAYVGNNPINITDPNGESWVTAMFGAIGFVAGALTGQPWTIWWVEGIMTGATAAGAQYTFEKAVNSGNIWAIAGVFVGGPPTFPDYSGLGSNGGVYGSGSVGPFIFSFEDARASAWQVGLANTADVIAGAGDMITFNVTAWARRKINGDPRNRCSGYYRAGGWVGTGLTITYGAAAGAAKAGVAGAGKEFSHWIPARLGGPRSLWNGNYVSVTEHALSDPSRYRFMPRSWKEANPLPGALTRQLNRIPNMLAGTAAGTAWATLSDMFSGPSCGN